MKRQIPQTCLSRFSRSRYLLRLDDHQGIYTLGLLLDLCLWKIDIENPNFCGAVF